MLFSAIIFLVVYFNYGLSPVSKSNNTEDKIVVIESGGLLETATSLKEYNLIRNKFCFVIYVKLTGKTLQASTYKLNEGMSAKEIIEIMSSGSSNYNEKTINITFKEGLNMRKIASLIEESTHNSADDVFSLLEDSSYIESLIEKYWFLTKDVTNSQIYYPLEGYLFPDTYNFRSEEVTVEEIFETLLDETENKLSNYKDEINSNDLSIHELLTLASIVEMEAASDEARRGVAGVFYNRLEINMSLGSDVTTYYAEKIDDWSRSLTTSELNDCSNGYNTRCLTKIGLPVGPICNPGIESIVAVLEPEESDYYYFVADCNKKTYFSKTNDGNLSNRQKLINENNWCG